MKIECPYCYGDSGCAWCFGTGKMKTSRKAMKKLGKAQNEGRIEESAPLSEY